MKKVDPIRAGLRKLPIRPVYLISMQHEGKNNIITIGMFAFFSGNPTLVGIGVKPSRFSYEMIRKSREFIVNVVDGKLMYAVRVCGESSGRNLDKFKQANLTPIEGTKVKAPLIEESPLSLECKVVKEVETGDHNWFIGEVQMVHASQDYDWNQGLLFKWIGESGVFFEVGEQKGKY